MSEYTKESIEKVIKFLEWNPLEAGMHLNILDKTTRREVIEKYLLPNIYNFIETPLEEEYTIFLNCKQIKDGNLSLEYKKCIKDILIER